MGEVGGGKGERGENTGGDCDSETSNLFSANRVDDWGSDWVGVSGDNGEGLGLEKTQTT